jgi:hypothetical protein
MVYVVSLPTYVKVAHFCLDVHRSGPVIYFFLVLGVFGGRIGQALLFNFYVCCLLGRYRMAEYLCWVGNQDIMFFETKKQTNRLTFRHRSFIFNSNKSPTWCNSFSVVEPARPWTQHDCHHDTKVKPEAATAVSFYAKCDQSSSPSVYVFSTWNT